MLAIHAAYCPYIHQCESGIRRGPWATPQRRLAHYLLVTSMRGSEQIAVEGKHWAVGPGQSYLIQPNALADIGSKRGNEPAWIHFDLVYNPLREQYRRADEYESELAERRQLLQPNTREVFDVDLPVLVPDSLSALFREDVPRIIRSWNERDELSILDANTSLSRLLFVWAAERFRTLSLRSPLSVEARIRQAENIARSRLGTGFRLAEFAEAAGLGRTRFSVLYRRFRGMSPGEFLREERIRQARHLLLATTAPVAEIGERVGYPEPTVFGRVFRSRVGQTPGQYRQRGESG